MLPFFRKNIKIVIWFIVISFMVWGVGTMAMSRDKNTAYAGTVFGEKISHKEFLTLYRFYDIMARASQARSQKKAESTATETQTPPDVPPPSEAEIRSMTWQAIILSREAKREHVTVSDYEVQEQIKMLFGGPEGFSPGFYENWVQTQFRTQPREFEEVMRHHLASQKIRHVTLSKIPETEREKKWTEWLTSVLTRAKFEDFTIPKPEPTNESKKPSDQKLVSEKPVSK